MRRSFRLPFRSRSSISAEVDEELAFHLEEMAKRLREEGWPADDAATEARRRFGDVEYTRDYCRSEDLEREERRKRMTLIDELRQDLRYAARTLRSSIGFTSIALATLGLGIGANTAIFSVVRGVLLDPLPFAKPDRLVRFWHSNPGSRIVEGSFSEPDLIDVKRSSKLAESIGGFFYSDNTGVDLTGNGTPERLSAVLVTPGFFETLRPNPFIGRVLAPDEQTAGRDKFVVLSYGLWQRRFGADRALLGTPITLNGDAYTVVGVMRPGFSYPAPQSVDVWIPLSNFGPDAIGRARPLHFISAIARLKPDVSVEQFHAEVAGIASRLARTYPDNPDWTAASVKPIRESIVGAVRRPLLILSAAVGMLLLMTCVNIASLLLARASARSRELAVRAALGAGRGRIVRQLLTESLLLALAGGALGALLGFLGVRLLSAQTALQLPSAGDIPVDGVVLGFTLGVSLLCGVIFGGLPAVRAAGPALEQDLRNGARGSIGARGQRLRGILVVTEVALAVILAAGASLATKSFARLLAINPGFAPSNALVVTMTIGPAYAQDERQRNYYLQVLDAVRHVPGVTAVGAARDLPTRGNGEAIRAENLGLPEARSGEKGQPQLLHVSPDFFKAMGVPIRAGREFTAADNTGAPLVVVVNETAARRFWPGETAVGKTLRAGKTQITVVGLVGDIRQRGLNESAEPTIYICALQNMRVGMSIVARTSGNPLSFANAVRNAIWSVDRNQPIAEVTTLDALLGSSVARPQLLAWMLSVFGFVGLVLGMLGLYGLLAFFVAQRRQEIGVRAALGAPPRAVLGLVMARGLALATGGTVAGIVAARLLARQMEGVLFGIASDDINTFAQVVVALIVTALLATWLPARRALAIDPVTALRTE
jgi:predicted permease